MSTNYNNTVTTPSNYYGPTGQPVTSRDHKKPFIIIAIIVALAIVIALVAISIINLTNNNSDDDSTSLVIVRENTPILELYATLGEDMTLETLQKAVNDSKINAEIFIGEDGFGTISIPESEDFIYFYTETEETEPYTEEDYADYEEDDDWSEDYDSESEGIEEEAIEENTEEKVNMLSTYEPSNKTYYFVYSRSASDEERIGISYVDEEGIYEVFDGYETYTFPTKQEAIEAYLSPEAKQ